MLLVHIYVKEYRVDNSPLVPADLALQEILLVQVVLVVPYLLQYLQDPTTYTQIYYNSILPAVPTRTIKRQWLKHVGHAFDICLSTFLL